MAGLDKSQKAVASLDPGLLARKGGATPAMRQQFGDISELCYGNEADLGWNDMGLKRKRNARPAASSKAAKTGKTYSYELPEELAVQLKIACVLNECSANEYVARALKEKFSNLADIRRIAAHVLGQDSAEDKPSS